MSLVPDVLPVSFACPGKSPYLFLTTISIGTHVL